MMRIGPLRSNLLMIALSGALLVPAQDGGSPRTLFQDSLAITGGYFNFTMRYTNVMATDVLLIGLGGGIVIDHWLEIGLAGAWSTSAIKNEAYESYLQGQTSTDLHGLELRYGYGGVLIAQKSAIHLSAPILIGMGSVAYSYPRSNSGSDSDQRNRTDGQAFFMLEPGLELEVSIVKALRIGIGGSYLYTSDLELPDTAPDALRNVMARMSVTFGAF